MAAELGSSANRLGLAERWFRANMPIRSGDSVSAWQRVYGARGVAAECNWAYGVCVRDLGGLPYRPDAGVLTSTTSLAYVSLAKHVARIGAGIVKVRLVVDQLGGDVQLTIDNGAGGTIVGSASSADPTVREVLTVDLTLTLSPQIGYACTFEPALKRVAPAGVQNLYALLYQEVALAAGDLT